MTSSAATELIDDREIVNDSDDRLGHSQIAHELAELVASVPDKSTIALFGAWGSGKSGIGNMLKAELAGGTTLYARFDAFKYVDNPMRRNFISVIARALGVHDKKYSSGLYESVTTNDFTVPKRKLFQLAWYFGLIALICAAIATLVVVVAALVQGHNVWTDVQAVFLSAIPGALVPASLLTAVIAFAGKTFTNEHRVEHVDSDEEFERLFAELVEKSKAKRVVVFIDELDRCSPPDVVRTLDAIRTFFGVAKTVFIVAADQQVLETALTTTVEQATPSDVVNPYYSAGSAYLDKVFQYQITVPPLLSQSVTSYAVALVDSRPGVWQEIDRNVVVSILVPAHVTSPRRVKTLLNAFTLTHRLAVARQKAGQLDIDLADAVDELARLVCLQVEFPLYARDLQLDPRLSEYVTALAARPNEDIWADFPYVSERVRQIASGYAETRRPVDRLMIDDDEEGAGSAAEVRRIQGQQLLGYLSRTSNITGPTKALLHLQSTGNAFGLSATSAEALEIASQNNDLIEVRSLVASLDPQEQRSAMLFMLDKFRTSVGIESDNVLISLLAAVPMLSGPLDDLADAIAGAAVHGSSIINQATLNGAWALVETSSRSDATTIGRRVLHSKLVEDNLAAFQSVLRHAAAAVRVDSGRAGSLLASHLTGEDYDEAFDDLESAQLAGLPHLLEAASEPLQATLEELLEQADAAEAAKQTAASSVRPIAVVGATEDEDDEDEIDAAAILERLGDAAATIHERSPESAEELLGVLLRLNRLEARNAAEPILALGQIASPSVSDLVLEQVLPRELGLWPTWLAAVQPAVLAKRGDKVLLLSALIAKFLNYAQQADATTEGITAVAVKLSPLVDASGDAAPALRREALKLGDYVEDESEIQSYENRVSVAQLLVGVGLVESAELNAALARQLVATLQVQIDEEDAGSILSNFAIDTLETVLNYRDAEGRGLRSPDLESVIAAIAEPAWLAEPDTEYAQLLVRTLVPTPLPQDFPEVPDYPTLNTSLKQLSKVRADHMVGMWLNVTDDGVNTIAKRVKPRFAGASQIFCEYVARWTSSLSDADRFAVVAEVVGSPGPLPGTPELQAIGLHRLSDQDAAELISARYKRETNNEGRRRVLQLWAAASISREPARKRLVLEVLIPMLTLNSEATDKALAFAADLSRPIPQGTKRKLGEAILAGTKAAGAQSRGEKLLQRLGYREQRSGFLGTKKSFDLD